MADLIFSVLRAMFSKYKDAHNYLFIKRLDEKYEEKIYLPLKWVY
jgi:hypothetical protein